MPENVIMLRREALKNATAILGSLLINALVLYAIGWLLILQLMSRPDPVPEPANEVVISLEELIPEIIQDEGPKAKSYLDTYANQESDQAPENAQFESDRNTRAATKALPTVPSDLMAPTQDGADLQSLELQDHKFVDAPDGEIPKSMPTPAGAPAQSQAIPQPPQPDSATPELVAETPAMTPAPKPSEITDPEQQKPQETPAESKTPDAKLTELETGDPGGMQDPIEMAKVDMPKTRESFSDELELLNEKMEAAPDRIDAMPERQPDVQDPINAMATAGAPTPTTPIVATPLMKPKEAAAPVPPGAAPTVTTNGMADSAAFSPERHKNRISGKLTNQGDHPAMDAERTPLGEYKKLVSRAIERRWHQLRIQNASFVSFGSLKISFEVDRDGKVTNIRTLFDDANAVVKDFSLRAVYSAEIPPMPEEIIDLLGEDSLEVTYDIIIF